MACRSADMWVQLADFLLKYDVFVILRCIFYITLILSYCFSSFIITNTSHLFILFISFNGVS